MRHSLITGFSLKINANLHIVLCPHFMSLADGFPSVDKEVARRASNEFRYLKRVLASGDHEFNLGVERVMLAFGCVPFRAHPQGTVSRKLENRPRLIGDLGGNRKVLLDFIGKHVGIVNELVRQAGFPKEVKAMLPQDMHANCVLQHAARIWGEPVIGWTDDFKDFFNNLSWAPSEWWLMTVLWLFTDAHRTGDLQAHRAEYMHILELGLGFGVACTSNWAQRFADGLLTILRRLFVRDERQRLLRETKPERIAYIRTRDALTLETGVEQTMLFAVSCFTDDSLFQVVGFERATRLLLRWRWLTVNAGIAMADAVKRQAGTSVLRLGLTMHITLGAVTIPSNKRVRTTALLSDVAAGAKVPASEVPKINGILNYLAPFTPSAELEHGRGLRPFQHWLKQVSLLGPQVPVRADAATRQAARNWINVLQTRHGVPCIAAVKSEPHAMPHDADGVVSVISGDAAKSGAARPGLAGYMYGLFWVLRLLPCDVEGPL